MESCFLLSTALCFTSAEGENPGSQEEKKFVMPLVVILIIVLGAVFGGLYLAKKRQQQEQKSHGMDTVKASITAISTVPAPH